LLWNRIVHASLQFLIDFFEFRLPPHPHRLAKHRKYPFPGLTTDMSESQKIECLGLSFTTPVPVFPRKPSKLQDSSFIRMEFQTKPP